MWGFFPPAVSDVFLASVVARLVRGERGGLEQALCTFLGSRAAAAGSSWVTLALGQPEVTPAWLETQTGVAYATLRRHYVKAMATEGARAAERLAAIAPPAFAFRPAGPPPWQFMDRAEKRP